MDAHQFELALELFSSGLDLCEKSSTVVAAALISEQEHAQARVLQRARAIVKVQVC